jgi:hypothetical protein
MMSLRRLNDGSGLVINYFQVMKISERQMGRNGFGRVEQIVAHGGTRLGVGAF